MTKTGSSSSQEASGSQHIDFDALYRGKSPGDGIAPMTTPPWDTKAPSESVIAWQTSGWVHGDVLDAGCGLGDNAVYLAENGHAVTGLDISPTALITAERRAKDAGVDVKFAVADSTKLDGYTDAFDTVIDSGMSTHQTYMALAALSERSSLSAQSPLGAILPVDPTIQRWRVGTGQHAPHTTGG